jgi:hypothetical protein
MKIGFFKSGLLFLALTLLIVGTAGAKNLLNEQQAFGALVKQIQKDKLYDSWTSLSCLSFLAEESTNTFIDFAIREKHDGKCPGDPATSPVVDRFRVNRITGKIQWFDPIDGGYKPYKAVLKVRLKK